jgi:alpha-1,2-mannosyltransferase
MIPHVPAGLFPRAVLAAAAGLAGVVGFTAGAGIHDDRAIATVVAIVGAAATALAIARRPGFSAAVAGAPPLARALFVAGCVAVGAQLAWLTPFVIDPARATWRSSPLGPMASAHSCLSSYWVAGQVVRQTPDVYDERLYNLPNPDPAAIRTARKLGPFNIDNYEYPPPFLIVPRLLASVTPDFWAFRRVWFALNLAVVAIAAIAVARRLDARLGTHAVWLTPFVLAGPASIATLQAGNVQLVMIAITALAMVCFDRRAYVLGGLLLAYAILGKLFPGVFVLYLLLQRDWRAVGWTAAFSAILIAVSLADVGWAPYRAFLEEMPGLMSGEAFSAFRNPASLAANGSVPGIVFKLKLWGVPHMGYEAMRIVGWAYTIVVVAGAVWLATRVRPAGREPIVWLAILVLATMRSPFMATYAFFPVMWLTTLAVPVAWRAGRSTWLLGLGWCALAVSFGATGLPPVWSAAWTTAQTGLTFVLLAAVLAQLREPVGPRAPAGAPGLATAARRPGAPRVDGGNRVTDSSSSMSAAVGCRRTSFQVVR